MPNENLNAVKDRVLTENTAQSVLKNLQNLRSNQAHFRTRWIWELLQNARDAKAVDVSVSYDEDKVVFRHDGDSFTSEEVTHLIYHGSTKIEDAGTIGQYGSGFLTTHLLSPEITVSGGFEDRSRFRFRLERKLSSVSDLTESMDRAWRDFQDSLASSSDSGDSGTEFIYPLDNDSQDVVDAVEYGIAMLKRCAPFAVVFNEGFSSIEIESRSETTAFRAARRRPLAEERGLREVVVEEITNQKRIERRYVVAQGDSAQAAIPVESNGDDTVCASILEIPKLFLGFPLIGTEDFGFPAVINSLKFTPTEFRDGVYLGRSGDEANLQNEKIIEETCALLVELIEFAAEYGWRDIPQLARVPQIAHRDWLNADWLKGRVNALFVEKVRQKSATINQDGERIPPNALKLPFASTAEDTPTLWNLLAERVGVVKTLPRLDEAAGWRDAVESWTRVANRLVSSYPETVDGDGLAKTVHNVSRDPSAAFTTHRVSRLGLKEGVDAIGWLDRLIAFLIDSGLRNSVLSYRIVPSQAGFLRSLLRLRRDTGIDKELKDIADLVDEWRVRPELRDARLASLSDEIGAGDWGNDDVVRFLIGKLNARAKENPDEICHKASARLFAWMAGRRDWRFLRDIPIFSSEYEAANRRTARDILKLDNSPSQGILPLAPVASWEKDLQRYSDLFPMRHTLAEFYFDAIPDRETWDTLARMGFVRNGVIVKDEVHLARFRADDLSDEDEHRTVERVPVTDVAFMTSAEIGIMARARQSRPRARLFWRFVTEWLINKDPDGLEVKQASCVCGEKHGYYPAEWIAPLRENKWIPIEGSRSARQADAQNLADLLRGGEWTPASLDDNPAAVKLLDAIGVARFDLTRSFMAKTDEERDKQERDLTNILDSTGGDLATIGKVAEYLKDDPELLVDIERARESRQAERGNQRLGAQVEELVKQSLESEGFVVSRTGIGSDFQIALDDAASPELARGGKTWLVEVKATQYRMVRMTDTQARTAVGQGDRFLLCVVPIDGAKPEPELDDVRASMRFVANIGARLGEICENLDNFEELRWRITAVNPDGVQLVVESGAARVRVASSVWENEGFPLDDLRGRLS